MLAVTVLVAIFAAQIATYPPPFTPDHIGIDDVFAPPSPEHILGQDDAGKDVFSQLVYGSRVSLLVGFTGALISRVGKEAVVAAGLLLLVGCAVVGLSGLELWQFWTALVLLGLGWNFGFIGATAMVAGAYRDAEKGRVQGLHDFILFGSVAFGSLMSGAVYNAYGWDMLNWIVFPVVACCLLALLLMLLARRRVAAA